MKQPENKKIVFASSCLHQKWNTTNLNNPSNKVNATLEST